MPIYEYACDACHAEFEVEQRITESPLKSCPQCRSRKLKRLISRTSFVLKGGGWYADLYSPRNAKSSDKEAPASGKDSDSKPTSTSPPEKPKPPSEKKAKGAKAAA